VRVTGEGGGEERQTDTHTQMTEMTCNTQNVPQKGNSQPFTQTWVHIKRIDLPFVLQFKVKMHTHSL
jgi:hypothetical protein